MTKIDIISGFLGAGKTTLIKKLLAEAYKGEKLVLIENEFGEISIDGGFLKDSGVQISEMSSGCICCSLVGDFASALKDVKKQFAPDRILIEPSGVGKLSDVIVAVENTVKDEPDMKLNSFVTVADASKVKVYMKNFGEFYNNQIESAGTIILSRTQKLSQEKLEAAAAMLREKNADAAIINSGTASLEAALIGTPQVVCWSTSKLTAFVARNILRVMDKIDFISLGNLCIGKCAFRELIQEEFTAENVTAELRRLTTDWEYRERMLDDYADIRQSLGGRGASHAVAKAIIKELRK